MPVEAAVAVAHGIAIKFGAQIVAHVHIGKIDAVRLEVFWAACSAEHPVVGRTVRTARGPRQQVVASLGKLDEVELAGLCGGRDELPALLRGKTPPPRPVTPPLPGLGVPGDAYSSAPRWEQADLRALRVERSRDFGERYLALSLWHRLGLDRRDRNLFKTNCLISKRVYRDGIIEQLKMATTTRRRGWPRGKSRPSDWIRSCTENVEAGYCDWGVDKKPVQIWSERTARRRIIYEHWSSWSRPDPIET